MRDNFAGRTTPDFRAGRAGRRFLNNPTNEQLSVLIGALVNPAPAAVFILWIVFWFIGNTARAGASTRRQN